MSKLCIDEYIECHKDILQVLHDNKTTAYMLHMDYIIDNSGTALYNYDYVHLGGMRFAACLL